MTNRTNLGIIVERERCLQKLMSKIGGENDVCVYLIDPRDQNSNGSTLKERLIGLVFENGTWVKKEVPRPDVVYDRGFFSQSPSLERELIKTLRESLSSVPKINSKKLSNLAQDKYEFARVMEAAGISHPETVENNQKNRTYMANKHDFLLFKPRRGSKGKGIIFVTKEDGLFTLSYKTKDEGSTWVKKEIKRIKKSQLYKTVEEVKKELGLRKKQYIIQQGLDLYEHEDKQTDVRYHGQRDEKGNLVNVGLVARVGGNVSQDGHVESYYKVTNQLARETERTGREIRDEMRDLGRKTYLALEKAVGSKAGEIGVDIVLDKAGKPYVIETNSKPGELFVDLMREYGPKTSIGIKARERRGTLARNLIGYAKYLAQN